jgi:signal peptidase II
MSIGKKSIIIILAILAFDQLFKIIVKTRMSIGQEIHVFDNWFILHFTENNGMAFGMDLPGENGKIFLSLFRILAVIAIAFYMRFLIRQKAHNGLVISVAMILAGAAGNIFDSLFYGMIFDDSWGKVATLFPEGGGYSSFLHGRVVDMLYFPIIKGYWPDWFPFFGGRSLVFFRPVFNIADSSITVGVFIILFFQRRFFAEQGKKEAKEPLQGTVEQTEESMDAEGTIS